MDKKAINEIVDEVIKSREQGGKRDRVLIYNAWSSHVNHPSFSLSEVKWILNFIGDLLTSDLNLLKEARALDNN